MVKSRIQNTVRVKGVVPKYNWTLPSIAMVAREEGLAALYKGFLPKVLRLGPGGGMHHYPDTSLAQLLTCSGILLVVYTSVVDFYKKRREEQSLAI